MFNPRFLTISGMILTAAVARLLPHPWNFTPVAAMSLFAGAHFSDKRAAFLVPLSSVFLSDAVIGFYPLWPLVYLAHLSVVGIGLRLQKHRGFPSMAAGAMLASTTFFVVSNLASFFSSGLYPLSGFGLAQCYGAAIPFFRNALIGDIFYTGLLFGGFRLAETRFPGLRDNLIPAT